MLTFYYRLVLKAKQTMEVRMLISMLFRHLPPLYKILRYVLSCVKIRIPISSFVSLHVSLNKILQNIMNINVDDIITIVINEGVDVEKLKIRYAYRYRRPSAFSNNHEHTNAKSGHNNRSKRDKYSGKEKMEEKSNSSANMTSVESKVSPPAMSPSRPQQTFYFGQNQEPSTDNETERKQSAIGKVNLVLYEFTLLTFSFRNQMTF